jgi:hypothetical protein
MMKFNTKFDDLSLRTQSILVTAVVVAVVSAIIYSIILFPIILGISIIAFGIGMVLYGVYVNVNLALHRRKWRLVLEGKIRYPQKED